MQVLGLDIGAKRIGVACGNTNARVATPLKVLDAAEVLQGGRAWRLILEDYEPEVLVCGLPKTLGGEAGKQAQLIRQQALKIGAAAGLPVEFVDERLSSAQAKRALREAGLSEKEMRGKLDSVAASLFLQTWLEGHGAPQGV